MGTKYRERPLTQVYPDEKFMETWLEDALGQLAPRVRGNLNSTPPISPELQQQLEKAKQAGEEQKIGSYFFSSPSFQRSKIFLARSSEDFSYFFMTAASPSYSLVALSRYDSVRSRLRGLRQGR